VNSNSAHGNSVWIWIPTGAALLISVAGILFELGRLDEQREEAQYRAAQSDIEGLDTYLRTCRQCEFKNDAERRLGQLFAAEIRSVGFDRAKLEKSLTICGLSCPGELRQEARRRLDILDAEKTQYQATSDDIERLEGYVRDCRGCEFKHAAELRLPELRKRALIVPPTPIFDSVEETRTIPDPVPEVPDKRPLVVPPTPIVESVEEARAIPDPVPEASDPDVEYQKAVRLDSIEGYAAFLNKFPNYPKNPTIRTLIERRQEDTLWKEPEQAPSVDEKKKSCERLLILDPQGVYAERARQCLAATAPVLQPQDSGSCYFVKGLAPIGKRWLALRTAPSVRAQQTNHVAPSTRLTLLERRSEWMHVRLESGETGWANSKYLQGCRNTSIPKRPVHQQFGTGVRVDEVDADSAAASAGIKPGDVIVTIGGKPINSPLDISPIVAASVKRPLAIDIDRGGTRHRLKVMPRVSNEPTARGNVQRKVLGISHVVAVPDPNLMRSQNLMSIIFPENPEPPPPWLQDLISVMFPENPEPPPTWLQDLMSIIFPPTPEPSENTPH
jgi:PDZ domain/Bacterial SH3 domain